MIHKGVIVQLTGLRGFVAAWVLFYHLLIYNDFELAKHVNGELAVFVFFTLSGFLMSFLYLSKDFCAANALSYACARIGRVVPVYLAALLLLAVKSKTLAVLWNATVLPLTPLGHLWTIPVECEYYMLFALYWAMSKWRQLAICRLLVLGLVILLYIGALARLVSLGDRLPQFLAQAAPSWFTTLPVACVNKVECVASYLPVFVTGGVLGAYWERTIAPFCAHPRIRILLEALTPLVLTGFLLNSPKFRWKHGLYPHLRYELYRRGPDESQLCIGDNCVFVYGMQYLYQWVFLDFSSYFLSTWLLIAAANSTRALFFFEWKLLQYLGQVSYGLYVWHIFILDLLKSFLQKPLTASIGFSGADSILCFILGAAASLVVASVSYEFFEAPTMAAIRSFPAKRFGTSLL